MKRAPRWLLVVLGGLAALVFSFGVGYGSWLIEGTLAQFDDCSISYGDFQFPHVTEIDGGFSRAGNGVDGKFLVHTDVSGIDVICGVDNYSWANKVTFPSPSVTGIYEIDDNITWTNQSNITEIDIPAGYTHIGSHFFNNCGSLKTVVIEGDGVSDCVFGDYTFQGCNGLSSVTIGEGYTDLPDYMLYGTQISSFVIPTSVRTIGSYCCSSCNSLKSFSFDSDQSDLITIKDHAWYGEYLTAIDLSCCDDLETIGDYVFAGAGWNTKSLILPSNSLTEVGDYCFYQDYNFSTCVYSGTSAQIGVVSFGASAFSVSGNTSRIYCESDGAYVDLVTLF